MVNRLTGTRIAIIAVAVLLTATIIYFAQQASHKKAAEKALFRKDSLCIAFDSTIHSGDPRYIGGDANSQYLEHLLFLPLIGFDEQGNTVNFLAKSIRQLNDTTYDITVKKGIFFANGKEVTAKDVVATYKAILEPSPELPASPRKFALEHLKSITQTEEFAVRIVLNQADSSFITHLGIGILPHEAVNAPPEALVGHGWESGPFLLVSRNESDWILKRNTRYTFSHIAQVKYLNFKIIPDAGTRYASIIRGDIDIAQNAIDPDKVHLIRTEMSDKFTIVESPRLSTTYLGFNFRDPLLRKREIRRAVALAINREKLLKYRLRETAILASGMFPPGNPYFQSKIHQIPWNPVKARELLKQSGQHLPLPFSLHLSGSNKTLVEIARSIAADLKNVGFAPSIEVLENSIFFDRVNKGVIKAWIAPWTGFKDPDHLRFVFDSSMVPPVGGNRGAFSYPRLDELLRAGNKEKIYSKRKKIYDDAQSLIAKELPYVYLWHNNNIAVIKKGIQGFRLYADGRYWSLIDVTKE